MRVEISCSVEFSMKKIITSGPGCFVACLFNVCVFVSVLVFCPLGAMCWSVVCYHGISGSQSL